MERFLVSSKTMKLLSLSIVLLLCGCGALEPPQQRRFKSLSAYDYAFINTTSTLHSGVGANYGGGDFFVNKSVSKSINPADIIAGILMKKGFIIVSSPASHSHTAQILAVNYGQSGKRELMGGLGDTALEVSIQMLDAQTKEPVYACTAEGQGDTEGDSIREAINRCLAGL